MKPIEPLRLRNPGYAGGSLDTQTVTVGAAGGGSPTFDRERGFGTTPAFLYAIGSISDGTSNLYSGAAIKALGWDESMGASGGYYLIINGTVANSGWTSMNIGGLKTLTRASATYSNPTGLSQWFWS